MNGAAKPDLRLAAIVCGIAGLYDVLYVATTLAGVPVLGFKLDILFPDYLVFHAASRAFFEGKLAILYDPDAFTHLQNLLYGAGLPYELGFRPFLYPPIGLLYVLPLGLMPLVWSVATFLVVTAAAAAGALRVFGLRWEAALATITAPAAVWVVFAGQNTFLSMALLYAGLGLLERRPVVAGILLGALAYKPQLLILMPLALLCSRQWRALAALALTVIVLGLASIGLFSIGLWGDFFAAAADAKTAGRAAEMFVRVRDHMTTLLAAAKILGAPDALALALQLAGALAAVAAVIWAFLRCPPSPARTAVLVTATFLLSPYTLNYDLLLLMPVVALLYLNPPASGYLPGERTVCFAAWLVPHFGLLLNHAGLPLTPLVVLLFGVIALLRLRPAR